MADVYVLSLRDEKIEWPVRVYTDRDRAEAEAAELADRNRDNLRLIGCDGYQLRTVPLTTG